MNSYLIIALLLICSAFFSASEIAYASVNKLRLRKASDAAGDLRHRWALYISENYNKALCTILIGNNLVNIASSSMATVIAIALVGNSGVAYATGIMTVLLLIFGEIVPKQLAKQNADRYVLFASPLVRALMLITKPLVAIFMWIVAFVSRLWGGKAEESGLSDDELVTIIEMVEEEGVIGEEHSELIQSAIEFDEIEAREVITHRVDILAIDIDDSNDEIIEIALASPHSRIPVYEGSIDNIIGLISLNHLLRSLTETENPDIRSMISDICYVHQSKTLPVLLEEMRQRKIHMAVVTDDYGGTLGILTMEDILEQLVGEIWDETDEIQHDITALSENEFEVYGNTSVYDFLEFIDMDPAEFKERVITMGGWSIEVMGNFPKVGESFAYKNLDVTIAEMDDLRVTKLRVELNKIDQG